MNELEAQFEQLAREHFARWNDLLKTKDPAQVAALYADDASFLPTLSEKFGHGKPGAVEYFEHFLQKDPIGTIIDEAVHVLSEHSFAHSGLYDFEVGPADDRSVAHARFTYIWRKNEAGEWQIIHHHSSLQPNR